jgi:hypothetical protein
VKPGVSSPSAAEPWPIRRVDASNAASSSAEAMAVIRCASTSSAWQRATKPAPPIPPKAQPACREDMIGRPTAFSTETP